MRNFLLEYFNNSYYQKTQINFHNIHNRFILSQQWLNNIIQPAYKKKHKNVEEVMLDI